MTPEVTLTDRPSPAARCAICHDDLRGAPDETACAECKVPFHVDCRADLARCPTLGCGPRDVPGPPGAPRLGRAIALSAVTALGAAAGAFLEAPVELRVAALALHLLVVPAWWAQRFSEARGAYRVSHFVAAAVGIAFVEAAVGAFTLFLVHSAEHGETRAADVAAGILGSASAVLLPPVLARVAGAFLHAPRRRRPA